MSLVIRSWSFQQAYRLFEAAAAASSAQLAAASTAGCSWASWPIELVTPGYRGQRLT